jgi:small basic protein (TIGR04137 family)
LFRPKADLIEENSAMSMHTSLKSSSKIVAKRNVLKRFERIDQLRKKGKWKDGDRAYNLPKTKIT